MLVALSVFSSVRTLAECELSHIAELLYSGFRIKIVLASLPRETYNDSVAFCIAVNLVICYTKVCKSCLDDLSSSVKLILACVVAVSRLEGSVNAALDVDTETNIINALDIGCCLIGIGLVETYDR